jgi:hypothetical protein
LHGIGYKNCLCKSVHMHVMCIVLPIAYN